MYKWWFSGGKRTVNDSSTQPCWHSPDCCCCCCPPCLLLWGISRETGSDTAHTAVQSEFDMTYEGRKAPVLRSPQLRDTAESNGWTSHWAAVCIQKNDNMGKRIRKVIEDAIFVQAELTAGHINAHFSSLIRGLFILLQLADYSTSPCSTGIGLAFWACQWYSDTELWTGAGLHQL